jgi:tetratricopeptide (TPR) repeat protein
VAGRYRIALIATLGLFLAVPGAVHGETGRTAEVQPGALVARGPWARLAAARLFYSAQLLESVHSWGKAADLYSRVVEVDPAGPFTRRAAAAALLGRQRVLNFDAGVRRYLEDRKERAKAERGPLPIPDDVMTLLAAYEAYFAQVPDGPATALMRVRRARIYYDYNHLDEAVRLFRDVFEREGETRLGGYAALMVAGVLAGQGRVQDLRDWARKVDEGTPDAFCHYPPFRSELSDAFEAEGYAYERRGRLD